MWRRFRLWIESLVRPGRFDRDLDDELAFHLRAREEHWRALGLTASEARRRARLEFGGVDKARAEVRDVRRGAWVTDTARDVRSGLRSLLRHRAFSAMAVLSLAIGIGANTVIVGVVRAVLFRDSPARNPETLVHVYETGTSLDGLAGPEGGGGFNPMSYPNVEDLRRGTMDVFSGIAASTFAAARVDNEWGGLMGEAVTGGAFEVLGIEPYLGRGIRPDEDVARGGHPVVVLSYGYWQRAFGGDSQAVGREMRMGGRSYTIIGVAPPGYRGGLPALTPAFYVPMAMLDELMGFDWLDQRDFHTFFVKARLAPGVTRADAEHAASLVAASLTSVRPEGWVPNQQFVFVPFTDVQVYPGLDPLLRAAALLLIVVVGLVLLLACTNLASFLLARALDRRQEVAVRRALGATRGALVRQWLIEGGLLGFAGAAAGLVLAIALLGALLSLDLPLPYGMRLDLHFGLGQGALLDWSVLAFTAGAGLLAGVFLGLVPAVQGTRADPGVALTTSRASDAPAALRWRNVLVVAQVAMSLVLLVGAGLFLTSWQRTLAVDPGFGQAPTSILTVMAPVTRPAADAAVLHTQRLLERFRAVPGAEAAGLVWPLPLEFSSSSTDFTIDGRVPPEGREAFRADRALVDGEFFEAAGMTIVSGRTFSDLDRRDSQPVAVISQAMARRYWPDGDALGRVLRRPDPADTDLTIVGIASDINVRSLGEPPRDVVYVHYAQESDGLPMFNVLIRTATDPARLSPVLIAAGREVDPDLRVMQATTMAAHLALSRLPSQMGAFMLSAFAVLAMVLAAVGVYGMVRYTVATRTREVGIRMALGADAASVVRQLATHGVRLVLIGGAIGVVVSVFVGRLLASLLFGLETFDPVALVLAPVALGITGWFAAWLPARRASRVDPVAALRAE